MAPSIALCMILKDEAHAVLTTICSTRGVTDRAVILDTGSTDGTQEISKAAAAAIEIPCTVFEEPFVDFATSRNRVLALHAASEAKSEWSLMLSADETLMDDGSIAEAIAKYPDATAFNLRIMSGASSFLYPRLTKTGSGWRYEGAVHENIVDRENKVDGTMIPTVEGAVIVHTVTDPERRLARMRNFDVPILRQTIAVTTDDLEKNRARLLLAQEYENLAAHEDSKVPGGKYVEYLSEAFALNLQRADAGGQADERNLAHLRMLRLASTLNLYTDAEVADRYKQLAGMEPVLPEVYFHFAVHMSRSNAAAGYSGAVAAARAAREAQQNPPRMPTDPSILWRAHVLAAACAKAGGQVERMKKSLEAALQEGAPVEEVKKVDPSVEIK